MIIPEEVFRPLRTADVPRKILVHRRLSAMNDKSAHEHKKRFDVILFQQFHLESQEGGGELSGFGFDKTPARPDAHHVCSGGFHQTELALERICHDAVVFNSLFSGAADRETALVVHAESPPERAERVF